MNKNQPIRLTARANCLLRSRVLFDLNNSASDIEHAAGFLVFQKQNFRALTHMHYLMEDDKVGLTPEFTVSPE